MVLPWMKHEKVLDAFKVLRETRNYLGSQKQVDLWVKVYCPI